MAKPTPRKIRSAHIGISLDEWLEEDGLVDEVNALLQKRAIAEQLRAAMGRLKVSEVAMAKRLKTSRTQVRRLLDPSDDNSSLHSLARAAAAVGCELRMSVVKVPPKPKPVRRTRAAR